MKRPPLDEALELLHFAFRAVVLRPDALLAARGLSRLHHRVLFFIRAREGLAVSELCEVLGVTKQALHRPLRELAERGLVELLVDPSDKRRRPLALTRAGEAFEAELSGLQREHFARAFAAAGPSAPAGWRAVMEALIAEPNEPT